MSQPFKIFCMPVSKLLALQKSVLTSKTTTSESLTSEGKDVKEQNGKPSDSFHILFCFQSKNFDSLLLRFSLYPDTLYCISVLISRLSYFNEVHGVIYIASLGGYNLMLEEDPSENRMIESIKLFYILASSSYFARTPFILFLNKTDLFRYVNFATKFSKKGFCTNYFFIKTSDQSLDKLYYFHILFFNA